MAQIASRSSPSSREPLSATARTRSPSPSKARPASAPASTTAARRSPGWLDPQPSLMLRPSGQAWSTATSAPRRVRTSAANADVAPLAQSTTRVRPERDPLPTEEATASAQGAAPSGSSDQLDDPPPPSRRGSASHAAWTADCTTSSSFRPPAENSFTPLSYQGLWEAETTAPATPSAAATWATAGVGATPRDTTWSPPSDRPSARASDNPGPDSRVSRPITTRSVPRSGAAARPRARADGSSSRVPARARTPSVPNRRPAGATSGSAIAAA